MNLNLTRVIQWGFPGLLSLWPVFVAYEWMSGRLPFWTFAVIFFSSVAWCVCVFIGVGRVERLRAELENEPSERPV